MSDPFKQAFRKSIILADLLLQYVQARTSVTYARKSSSIVPRQMIACHDRTPEASTIFRTTVAENPEFGLCLQGQHQDAAPAEAAAAAAAGWTPAAHLQPVDDGPGPVGSPAGPSGPCIFAPGWQHGCARAATNL